MRVILLSNLRMCCTFEPRHSRQFPVCHTSCRGEQVLVAANPSLHYAGTSRFPVNIRGSKTGLLATTIRFVVLASLLAGCTTVQTERTSVDLNLRSRTVRGPTDEIFNLVARCVYREFPGAHIRSYPTVGEIEVTDYSLMGGDAVIKITVIGWPDGRVEVNASSTGVGAAKQKAAVGKILSDFDQAYADWAKDGTPDRPAIE